jgi:outer membrane protein assembly factor BamB
MGNRTAPWLVPCGFLAVLAVASEVAADWARFRGPNGTGVATGQDLPLECSAETTRWKVPLPGVGNSSPVVWGRQLFVQSSSADGKERYLLCLDTADGKVRWSRSVPGGKARLHQRSSLASSTPAVDGVQVYAYFWDGKGIALYAFDLQGNSVWQRNLGGFESQHGAGASPVVYQGKVFVNNDQDGSAEVVALDAQTGAVAWRKARQAFRACYSTPFVLERPGAEPEIVVTSTAGITSYRPKDGTENWNWTWQHVTKPLRTVGSPVYSQGLIFAGSGDGDGSRHLVAVNVAGGKPSLAWQKERGTPYVPCLLTAGEHLFYVNDLGVAGCFVARTGEAVWSERLGGDVTASPVLVDGKIYAVSEDGHVYVFPAETSFRMLAKSALGETVRATPAVADGRLFIRGQHHLFCFGKK